MDVDWVREFYCNWPSGMMILSLLFVGKILRSCLIFWPVFLALPDQVTDKSLYNDFTKELLGARHLWPSGVLAHGDLLPKYRFLNWFYYANMEPRGHTTTINHQQGTVLYRIGMGNNINVPLMIYIVMVKISSAVKNATLPYTCFLLSKKVTKRPHDEMKRLRGPINQRTLQQASADIDEGGNEDQPEEEAEVMLVALIARMMSMEGEMRAGL